MEQLSMSSNSILNLAAMLGLALSTSVCTTTESRNNAVSSQTVSRAASAAQHIPPGASAVAITNSPIRYVDFNKVTYPEFPDYSKSKAKHVTLKAGEGRPSFVNYGDITGDGVEEAMVVLSIENRGSAIPYYVYIFTEENQKPKLLWNFETGDRADGGLRQIYAENGQLVVELFGKDRVVGGDLYKGDEGLCCPTSFTRTRYRWTGKDFQQISQENFGNPKGNASPVMSSYSAG
jgi:hypothetical protein